jgi:hypothetical protein
VRGAFGLGPGIGRHEVYPFHNERDRHVSAHGKAVLLRHVQRHRHEKRRPVGPSDRHRERGVVAEAHELNDDTVDDVVLACRRIAAFVQEHELPLRNGPRHLRALREIRLERRAQSMFAPFDRGLALFRIVAEDPCPEHVLEAHELCDLRAFRLRHHFVRDAGLQRLPVIEHRHPVGEHERFVEIMGDEDHRYGELAPELSQLGVEPLTRRAIDRSERLVQQKHVRLPRERARDRDPLLLSPRQLCREALLEPVQMHPREQVARPALSLAARDLDH